MYKLVILIDTTAIPHFHVFWPRFLHAAENIPGLRREATSRVNKVLYGDIEYSMIHELFFDTLAALNAGLASEPGKEAGMLLQEMTGGKVNLLIADHAEDDMANIRKYKGMGQNVAS
jgi:hypothetical protein